jgi:hypothetical protein
MIHLLTKIMEVFEIRFPMALCAGCSQVNLQTTKAYKLLIVPVPNFRKYMSLSSQAEYLPQTNIKFNILSMNASQSATIYYIQPSATNNYSMVGLELVLQHKCVDK